MRLKDLGEFGFISRITDGCVTRSTGVILGIGDDCCVFRSSGDRVLLLTTDMLVEKVHFIAERIPPEKLGRKSLAVNLSDVAAMGGIPREAVVSLAVPSRIEISFLDALYLGMKSIAAEYEVNLLGGDTTSSPDYLVINIALTGEAREGEIIYRSGAQPGDRIFVTGFVGSSAAGLDLLLSGNPSESFERLLKAHFDPRPHVHEGRLIAGSGLAHSLIDVSDGVASDLGHICEQSRIGAIIEEALIPTEPEFETYCERFGRDRLRLALHVGEDYVLLGTASEDATGQLKDALTSQSCALHAIGRITREPGLRLQRRDGRMEHLAARGWDHFKRNG
jgi:thiamine-monophosphate kinase